MSDTPKLERYLNLKKLEAELNKFLEDWAASTKANKLCSFEPTIMYPNGKQRNLSQEAQVRCRNAFISRVDNILSSAIADLGTDILEARQQAENEYFNLFNNIISPAP